LATVRIATINLVGILTVLLSGCNTDSNSHDSVTVVDSAGVTIVKNTDTPANLEQWQTEPALTIGQLDGPDEYTFGLISDVDIDARGRVLVLDRQAQHATVYSPAGEFLFRIGGAGEGPGEFSMSTVQIRAGIRDSIFTLDGWQMRITVFDQEGSTVRTLPMRHSVRPGPYQFQLLDDGRLLVRWFTVNVSAEGKFVPWDALLLTDSAQTKFDTLLTFDYRPPDQGDVRALLRPLIVNAAFYDVLSEGDVIWSDLEGNELTVHGLDGSLKRIVRNSSWSARATNDADREALTDVYLSAAEDPNAPLPENITFPDIVPTITAVLATPDGGFWVRRMGPLTELDPIALHNPYYVAVLGGTTWEVHDREGRWYANVEVPHRYRMTRVRGATIVGVVRDELDVERVQLLRIVR